FMPIACTAEISIPLILKGKLDHTFVEQQRTHFLDTSNMSETVVIASLLNAGALTNLAYHFLGCPHIPGFICTIRKVQHHFRKAHFYPIHRVSSTGIVVVVNRCA